MQPQPSTSAGNPRAASTSGGDPLTATGGVQDAVVASTSGSPPGKQPQLEGQLFFYDRASFRQCHQLFASTCRVKLQRCDDDPAIPSTDSRAGPKVEEDSKTGNSSSEDDQVKVLPVPPAAPRKQKGSIGTKKKRKKRVSRRKSSDRCTICRKTFTSEYLKIHMQSHTVGKLYKCDTCGGSFWNRASFTKHNKAKTQRNGVCPRKSSGGWRPKGAWTCSICGKRMKHPSYYLDHMRIHRGEKPFKCGICGKAFPASSGLSQHKKNHTGDWSHKCVFCDKGFHRKASYWDHLRSHAEEKPYFCVEEDCGASFRRLYRLKIHRRMVHLNKY